MAGEEYEARVDVADEVEERPVGPYRKLGFWRTRSGIGLRPCVRRRRRAGRHRRPRHRRDVLRRDLRTENPEIDPEQITKRPSGRLLQGESNGAAACWWSGRVGCQLRFEDPFDHDLGDWVQLQIEGGDLVAAFGADGLAVYHVFTGGVD